MDDELEGYPDDPCPCCGLFRCRCDELFDRVSLDDGDVDWNERGAGAGGFSE